MSGELKFFFAADVKTAIKVLMSYSLSTFTLRTECFYQFSPQTSDVTD